MLACPPGMSVEDVLKATAEVLDKHDTKIAFSPKMRRNHEHFSGNTLEFLTAKYERLNEGMQRMNCGNLLRGLGKRLEAQA